MNDVFSQGFFGGQDPIIEDLLASRHEPERTLNQKRIWSDLGDTELFPKDDLIDFDAAWLSQTSSSSSPVSSEPSTPPNGLALWLNDKDTSLSYSSPHYTDFSSSAPELSHDQFGVHAYHDHFFYGQKSSFSAFTCSQPWPNGNSLRDRSENLGFGCNNGHFTFDQGHDSGFTAEHAFIKPDPDGGLLPCLDPLHFENPIPPQTPLNITTPLDASPLHHQGEDRIVGGFNEPEYGETSVFNLFRNPLVSAETRPFREVAMESYGMVDNYANDAYNTFGSKIWGDDDVHPREDGTGQQMMEFEFSSSDLFGGLPGRETHGPDAKVTRNVFQGYPNNLAAPYNNFTSYGHLSRPKRRRRMGQEVSQQRAAQNLKQAAAERNLAHGNGWTSVNRNEDHDSRENGDEDAQNSRKRKRTPSAEVNGGIHGKSSQPSPHGKSQPGRMSMPQQARPGSASSAHSTIVPSRSKPSHLPREAVNTHAHEETSQKNGVQSSQAKGSKTTGNRKGEDSESDVDTDALGFLQRVADAESDEEEERPAVLGHVGAGHPAKPREIRPNPGVPHHWRPPHSQVGLHYTIYSPHVQAPSYPPARPAPETFDPNAPLSAHEEAQLRDEGRFTKMEQSFLKDAIDEYCKKHDISVELANDYVCGKAREGNIPGNFWDEVCQALPQRTKNSIQRAAKRVFRNNQKKGTWTTEEETALAEAYAKAPDQWAKICEEVPGRSAEQCRDRWRNYTQNGGQLTRGPWTDAEEARFVQICKDMLKQAHMERRSQREQGRTVSSKFDPIDHLNFTAISALMEGKRSRLHCRNKWHKLKKRPDIEAAVEAIVKGSITASRAAHKSTTSASSSILAPIAAPTAAERGKDSAPPQLPSVSQALASLPLPASRPHSTTTASIPTLGSAGHTKPNGMSSISAIGAQMYRPSPTFPLSHLQGPRVATSQAVDTRPASASVPPPASSARPSLPPPLPSAPAVARKSTLPAIMAPFPDRRRNSFSSTSLAGSAAPPSWANTPPRVPQLFAPAYLKRSPDAHPDLVRATLPAPKAMLSGPPAGLCASFADGSYGDKKSSERADTSTKESRELHVGPRLPPIKSASHHMFQADASDLASEQPLPSMVGSSMSTGPTKDGNAKDPSSAASAAASGSRPDGLTQEPHEATTSPSSEDSSALSDEKSDGRPVGKKRKTAKARGVG